MKKISLKSLFSLTFVFFFLTLTSFCFGAAKENDEVYLEKPTNWADDSVYVQLTDTSDNSNLFPEPGMKMDKFLDGFSLNTGYESYIFSIKDVYKVTIPAVNGKNYDKISFSNGNEKATTIEYSTKIFKIDENLNVLDFSESYSVGYNVTLQRFYNELPEKNKTIDQNLLNTILSNVQSGYTNLLKYCLNTSDVSTFEFLTNLSEVSLYMTKPEDKFNQLDKKISDASNAVNDPRYIEDNKDDLRAALPVAQEIRENYIYYTNDQVDDIIERLNLLMKKLVVDTTELEKLYEKASQIDKSKYTEDSTNELTDKMNDAKNALDNKENLTIEELDRVTNNLNDAINNLVADTSALEDLINKANNIDKSKYTEDSVKNLENVVDEAQNILTNDDTDLTVEKIEDISNKLNDAINSLKEKSSINSEQNKTDVTDVSDVTVTDQSKSNPSTGDVLAIILIIMVIAIVVIGFTSVYLKKKKINTKK